MSAANGNNADYCVGAQCSAVWLTVTTSDGSPVTFSQGCAASCTDCVFVACPPVACALPQPMKTDGETTTWDGSDWRAGTCGAQMTTCRARTCAAPGKYIAHMCASRKSQDAGALSQCSPAPTQTCVDVPFAYPTDVVVQGTIN
jgi:hypothetical protein